MFLGCWGYIGHYGKTYLERLTLCFFQNISIYVLFANAAYRYGDLNQVLLPTDSEGLMCGVDSDVLHKPYLMFFDIQKCIDPLVVINGCSTPQVCVEQCPRETFVFNIRNCNDGNVAAMKSKLVCSKDVAMNMITDCDQIETLINANKCARWYLKSESCKYFLNLIL